LSYSIEYIIFGASALLLVSIFAGSEGPGGNLYYCIYNPPHLVKFNPLDTIRVILYMPVHLFLA